MKSSILVVEDDQELLEAITYILEGEGYEVVTSENGIDALLQIAMRDFSLLLSDLQLPGIDGLAVMEYFHKRFPSHSAVLMTAYASIPNAVSMTKKGAADYLSKPLDAGELLIVINKLLN